MENLIDYWDGAADTKSFTLPFDLELFGSRVSRGARILDYGCGYGRICRRLWEAGYRNLVGTDPSRRMIQRGKEENPHLDLRHIEDGSQTLEEGTFDAVILFAVLTCIPRDEDQIACVREILSLLRPGGVLYASDFWIQKDPRNIERYERYEREHGTYGIFELPEGAVLRHHDRRWISNLLTGLTVLHQADVVATTMNNHKAVVFQYLGRKESQ